MQWLDSDKSVKSRFKTLNKITLYFNVKFYIPDPCKLRYEATRLVFLIIIFNLVTKFFPPRYLFYMQLRADILQGRLPLQFDYAVDLFGYVYKMS